MSKKTTLTFDPTGHFHIHDVALWSTSLERERAYEPALHAGKCQVQTRRGVKPEFLTVIPEGQDTARPMLRVYVDLGVRSVCREADVEEALYTLDAVFAVDYYVLDTPTKEQFETFVNFNSVHNVWPFWRQHVYDTLKRASLPVPAVPLFSGAGIKKKRRSQSQKALTAELMQPK